MATPFYAQVVYKGASPTDRYTVPAGKVAVANLFSATRGFMQGTDPNLLQCPISVNTVGSFAVHMPYTNPHAGPFVFNAGDMIQIVIGNKVDLTRDAWGTTPKLGIIGELYDAFSAKIPFGAVLKQNVSNYTVPSGKLARFMTFMPYVADGETVYGNGWTISINGTDAASVLFPGVSGDNMRLGPIIAKAGDVISVIIPLGNAGANVGKCYINGWLYNV